MIVVSLSDNTLKINFFVLFPALWNARFEFIFFFSIMTDILKLKMFL